VEILGGWQPVRWLQTCLAVVLTMPLGIRVGAQGATAPALKAAFLYNFAKFAQWPVEVLALKQTLSLCVVGDSAVAEALEQTIKGQGIDSHPLTVEIVKADGPIHGCHLLYVSGLDRKQAGQLLSSMKNSAAFTVSDGERFAQMGGVAQLIPDSNRLRFAINPEAARRARLRISSKLLTVAQIVKDEHDVPQ
jgi:hypothetical protein